MLRVRAEALRSRRFTLGVPGCASVRRLWLMCMRETMLQCVLPNAGVWWWWWNASEPAPSEREDDGDARVLLKPPSAPDDDDRTFGAVSAVTRALRAAAMNQCGDYGTCPICMNEWPDVGDPNDMVFLTCQDRARVGDGPVHAVCAQCWNTMRKRCPLCQRERVRGMGAEAYARWCLKRPKQVHHRVEVESARADARESVDEVIDEFAQDDASMLNRAPAAPHA